jgi:hypothetical protein
LLPAAMCLLLAACSFKTHPLIPMLPACRFMSPGEAERHGPHQHHGVQAEHDVPGAAV